MTYNHEQFITQAIESCLSQKADFNFEIVIGDDFSNDETLKICKEYERNYPKIVRVLKREKGGNYHVNRLKLGRLYNFFDIVRNCDGKYIALLDGDDYWIDSSKIQSQLTFLNSHPDVGLVFTNAYTLDTESNKILGRIIDINESNLKMGFREFLFTNKVLPTASFVFRKEDLNNEMVDDLLKTTFFGDGLLVLSLFSKKNEIVFINDTSAVYRVNNTNSITYKTQTEYQIKNWIRVLKKSKKHFPKRKDRNSVNAAIAFHYFRLANFRFNEKKIKSVLALLNGMVYAPYMTKKEFKDGLYWLKQKLLSTKNDPKKN